MRLDLLRVVERHQMLFIGVASSIFLSGLMAAPLRFGPVRAVAEVEVPKTRGFSYPTPIIGPDLRPLALARRDVTSIGEWADLAASGEFHDSVARRLGVDRKGFTLEARAIPGTYLLEVSGEASTPEEVVRVVDAAADLLHRISRQRLISQQAVPAYLLRVLREPGGEWSVYRFSPLNSADRLPIQCPPSSHGGWETERTRRVMQEYALKLWEIQVHPEHFEQQPLRVISWAHVAGYPSGPAVALLWLALSTMVATAAAALRDRCVGQRDS